MRLLAQSDVMNCPAGIERAVYLRVQYHVPLETLQGYFGVSRFAIKRAVEAKGANRAIGQIGRPRALDNFGEDVLVKKVIDSFDRLDCLCYEDVAVLVCSELCISNI